ncbi:MAG TPA: VPDSG-CTERM sorting domain-containing protein [Opitutaceae bacterium]|nr:VPDSG-CTERM sorting domain-containing protein [Opitutaceae bacterium]
MVRRSTLITATLGLTLLVTAALRATPITFTGSGTNSLGNTISATAVFDTSIPGHLTLTLSNTYTQVMHIGGSVVYQFTYSGTLPTVTNVQFVYGTSAGEGGITGHSTPVPDGGSTVALLGAALAGLGLGVKRRRIQRV